MLHATLSSSGEIELVDRGSDKLFERGQLWIKPDGKPILLAPVKRYVVRGQTRSPNPVGRALFLAGYRPGSRR